MTVEGACLFADRLHYPRMTMAHMRHVIVAIEIFSPSGIPDPNAITAHKMQGLIIERRDIGAKQIEDILDSRGDTCFVI